MAGTAGVSLLCEFLGWLPRYFFPRVCFGCGGEGSCVCPDCLASPETALEYQVCPICQQPSATGATHPSCMAENCLDGLISGWRYAGWGKKLMKSAKFEGMVNSRGLTEISRTFGHQLSAAEYPPFSNFAVAPVPLHWLRKRVRGYNQAELTAKELARQLRLSPPTPLLTRTRFSQPQTLLRSSVALSSLQRRQLLSRYPSVTQQQQAERAFIQREVLKLRRKNVRGGFAVRDRLTLPHRILVVDDVWTTGATLSECCRVLKRAGAQTVWGMTLFRA